MNQEEFKQKLKEEAAKKAKTEKRTKQTKAVVKVVICTGILACILVFFFSTNNLESNASFIILESFFALVLIYCCVLAYFMPIGKIDQKTIDDTYDRLLVEKKSELPSRVESLRKEIQELETDVLNTEEEIKLLNEI